MPVQDEYTVLKYAVFGLLAYEPVVLPVQRKLSIPVQDEYTVLKNVVFGLLAYEPVALPVQR